MKVWTRLDNFHHVINLVEPIPGFDDYDDWEEMEIDDEELRLYFEALEVVDTLEDKISRELMARMVGVEE